MAVEGSESAAVEVLFGQRVRELRTALGWTQAELARRMSAGGDVVRQTTVTRIESGQRATTIREVAVLAGIFETTPGELLDPRVEELSPDRSTEEIVAELARHQVGLTAALTALAGRVQDDERLRR